MPKHARRTSPGTALARRQRGAVNPQAGTETVALLVGGKNPREAHLDYVSATGEYEAYTIGPRGGHKTISKSAYLDRVVSAAVDKGYLFNEARVSAHMLPAFKRATTRTVYYTKGGEKTDRIGLKGNPHAGTETVAEAFTYSKDFQRGDYAAHIHASDGDGPFHVHLTGPGMKDAVKSFMTPEAADYFVYTWLGDVIPIVGAKNGGMTRLRNPGVTEALVAGGRENPDVDIDLMMAAQEAGKESARKWKRIHVRPDRNAVEADFGEWAKGRGLRGKRRENTLGDFIAGFRHVYLGRGNPGVTEALVAGAAAGTAAALTGKAAGNPSSLPSDYETDWYLQGYVKKFGLRRLGGGGPSGYRSYVREVSIPAEDEVTFAQAKQAARVLAETWPEVEGVELSRGTPEYGIKKVYTYVVRKKRGNPGVSGTPHGYKWEIVILVFPKDTFKVETEHHFEASGYNDAVSKAKGLLADTYRHPEFSRINARAFDIAIYNKGVLKGGADWEPPFSNAANIRFRRQKIAKRNNPGVTEALVAGAAAGTAAALTGKAAGNPSTREGKLPFEVYYKIGGKRFAYTQWAKTVGAAKSAATRRLSSRGGRVTEVVPYTAAGAMRGPWGPEFPGIPNPGADNPCRGNPSANLTADEDWALNYWTRYGSAGYINKLGKRGWSWGPIRGIKGPPVVFKTKREAVESYEAFIQVLLDKHAGRLPPTIKRNPDSYPDSPEEAAEMYKKFHGRPSEETLHIEEEEHYHEDLTALGSLVELQVLTESGYDSTIDFSADSIILSASEDGRQLYFVGGNQKLSLSSLHMNGSKWRKDLMAVGRIKKLVYCTEKSFDNFETFDYWHDLGEDTGVLPMLLFDTLSDRMKFAGGQYDVRAEGITN